MKGTRRAAALRMPGAASADRVLFAWAGDGGQVSVGDVVQFAGSRGVTRPGQLVALVTSPSEQPRARLLAHVLLGVAGRVPLRVQLRLVADGRTPMPLRASAICQLSQVRGRSTAPARALVRVAAGQGLTPIELRVDAAYWLRQLKRVSRADLRRLASLAGSEETDPVLRGMVIETLGELGDRRARGVLVGLLGAPGASTRFWAAFALSCLGPGGRSPLACDRLVRLLADDSQVGQLGTVAQEASYALRRLGYRS